MLARLRAKLSFANVVSVAALFVAFGGSAYAVTALDRNSVKSRHIAPNAAKGVDVDEASLNSAVLQDRIGETCPEAQAIQSVSTTGAVTCEASGQGPPGEPEDEGAPGPPGPTAGALSAAANQEAWLIPPQTPTTTWATTEITTSTSGRLYVEGYLGPEWGFVCQNAGVGCSVRFGLYVNDVAVPRTGNNPIITSSVPFKDSISTAGITDTLPAGTYTVKLAHANGNNVQSFSGATRAHVSAILLGG